MYALQTDLQIKLPKIRTERQRTGEAKRDLPEVQNFSMAQMDDDTASQKNSPSKIRDAPSSRATMATASTATQSQEDVRHQPSMEISIDRQKAEEEPCLHTPIENEQEAKIKQLQAYLEQMRSEHSELQSELREARMREENILQNFDTHHEDYQLENQELLQDLQTTREESKQLKIANDSLQETLDRIQERAFRSMDKGGWTAPEDGKVRDNFLRLEGKIKKWAKTNAFQIASGENLDYLTAGQKQEIIQSLSGYCISDNWDQIIQMMAPSVAKKVSYLFAHAMLSKDIFGRIFMNPFLTLEVLGDARFPAASQIFNLYRAMAKSKQARLSFIHF